MVDEDFEIRMKKLRTDYYKCGYGFVLKRCVKKLLEENKDNFYLLKNEPFAKEMVKDLGRSVVNDYVKDAINSCDSTKIYNCAYMVCCAYPEFLHPLVDAIIKTGDANAIGCFAIIVKGVDEYHFLELAKALVDLEDYEVIVDFSIHISGAESCFNSFDILTDFVDMIKTRNNKELENKIISEINERQNSTRGMPRDAIPYGIGVCTEQLNFRDMLYKRISKNNKIIPFKGSDKTL